MRQEMENWGRCRCRLPGKTLFSGKVSIFAGSAAAFTLEGTGRRWVPVSQWQDRTAEMNDGPASNHAWFVGWTPILSPKYDLRVL